MALNNDDIKQLISILQRGLSEDTDEPVETKSNKKVKTKTKPKSSNKFESMAEFRMHKDDVAIDKKLCQQPPTERSRQYKPIKIHCRVCHKEELVNPSMVESIDRYKCNKCSIAAG